MRELKSPARRGDRAIAGIGAGAGNPGFDRSLRSRDAGQQAAGDGKIPAGNE
jgi:hypothetical protein